LERRREWEQTLSDFISSTLSGILANIIFAAIAFGFTWIISNNFRTAMKSILFSIRMSSSGVINFYCSRDEYRTHRKETNIDDYVLRAKKSLTYIGHALDSGVSSADISSSFKKLLENDVKIKLILLSPETEPKCLEALERYLRHPKGQLRALLQASIDQFQKLKNDTQEEKRINFEILTHQEFIAQTAFQIDLEESHGFMLVDTKIYGVGKDHSFGIEFEKIDKDSARTLFKSHLDSFEKIKNLAKSA